MCAARMQSTPPALLLMIGAYAGQTPHPSAPSVSRRGLRELDVAIHLISAKPPLGPLTGLTLEGVKRRLHTLAEGTGTLSHGEERQIHDRPPPAAPTVCALGS